MTDWIDSQRCWLSVEPLPGYAPDRNPLEQIVRTAGDSEMVVSATPSENTVRFYLGRGDQPTADPLAELFELEPEDVHMRKML